MSSTSSKKPGELGSAQAGALSQQKQHEGVLALSAPRLPEWWDGDTAFAGLVPRQDQEVDMTIRIDEWENSAGLEGDFDYLFFQWKPADFGDWRDAQSPITVPGPHEPGDFPIELKLSKDFFAVEGRFDLRYFVDIWNGTRYVSDVTTFIIDKTPPNASQTPAALTFVDASIISDGITAEYLAANGGVAVIIPDYLDKQSGDSLELFIYNGPGMPTEPVFMTGLDTGMQVTVPASAFENLSSGLIYLSYRLVDKVGNCSPFSRSLITSLSIKPQPVAFTH